MVCTTSKMNAACAKFNKEKDVNGLQEECLDCEEIASQQLWFLMCHRLLPTWRGLPMRKRWDAISFEDIRNSLVTDMITELA